MYAYDINYLKGFKSPFKSLSARLEPWFGSGSGKHGLSDPIQDSNPHLKIVSFYQETNKYRVFLFYKF